MQFNLTFNKPAATMFFGTKGTRALKIKIAGDRLMVKPVGKETGNDIFQIEQRTRGGVGVTVTGRVAQAFIDAGLERGVHLPLEATSHNWIVGQAFGEAGEKPSKIVPTARLWRNRDETSTKAADAPARAPRARKSAATKTAAKATAKPAAKKAASKPAAKKSTAKRASAKSAASEGAQA